MILPYRDKGNLLIQGRPCGMEMHQGRRPVYGGAPRTGVNIWTQTKSHGGSRGPADPWSAAAASKRRDLWFFQS